MPETQESPHDRDILARIVATKEEEVARLRGREAGLRARAAAAPPPRDFRAALEDPKAVGLIAEVKRRSPGAGAIRPGLDPAALAGRYEAGGAAAVSVLTDAGYFGGSLEDLERVRQAVRLPCLRKDFIIDERQVWEARGAGADAVLLIVRILEDAPLRELRLAAEALGMAALVEVHDRGELVRAVASGAGIIGINNRDLRTFETHLEVTLSLAGSAPDDAILVSESGVRTAEDVRRLGAAGVDAVLVGEAMVRAADPEAAARALTGLSRTPRGAAT